jgi:hypothetical protein
MVPPQSSSKPTATNKTPIKDMESKLERADDLAELVTQMANLQRPPDANVVKELVDLHKQLKSDYVQIRQALLVIDAEIRRRGEVQAHYDRLTELHRSLAVWEEIGEIVQEEFIPMDDDNESQG